MGLPVFSVAIKNIITAYKHSGMLEGGAELQVASASALLMNPSDAVSLKVLHGMEHSPQSSVALPRSPGLAATARCYPVRGAVRSRGGSAEDPREYLICTMLSNITRKLVQFISMFLIN